jgi:hypothetical protein
MGVITIRAALAFAAVTLSAGCSVTVSAGYGNPQAQHAYLAAIAGPMRALTAAAAYTSRTCAGGATPSQAECYTGTVAEIRAVTALEKAMRSVPISPRYATANKGMLKGLAIFASGLAERNKGLAGHSAAEYAAGDSLIARGLALQRRAIAEYPASAHITL